MDAPTPITSEGVNRMRIPNATATLCYLHSLAGGLLTPLAPDMTVGRSLWRSRHRSQLRSLHHRHYHRHYSIFLDCRAVCLLWREH